MKSIIILAIFFLITLFSVPVLSEFAAIVYAVDNSYQQIGEDDYCYNFTSCRNKLCEYLNSNTSLTCGDTTVAPTSSVVMYPLINWCDFTDVPQLERIAVLTYMIDLAGNRRPIDNTITPCKDFIQCIAIQCRFPSPEFGMYGFKGFCF